MAPVHSEGLSQSLRNSAALHGSASHCGTVISSYHSVGRVNVRYRSASPAPTARIENTRHVSIIRRLIIARRGSSLYLSAPHEDDLCHVLYRYLMLRSGVWLVRLGTAEKTYRQACDTESFSPPRNGVSAPGEAPRCRRCLFRVGRDLFRVPALAEIKIGEKKKTCERFRGCGLV
jgi:hypothetical protein